MERIPCCICGSQRHMRVWAWIARDEYAKRIRGAPARSRWVVCQGCGLVFQNPRPDAADMQELYADNGYRDWKDVPENFFTYSRRRSLPMLRWLESLPELRPLLNGPPERRTVVDVGCGVGGAVKEFAERGWRAFGVEPDPLLARSGTARFGVPIAQAFMNEGLFPDVEFSLIFSVHTFEHLLDPSDVARSARRLLARNGKSGGYLFVAVPTFARATHPAWEWMNTAHTYLFTSHSLGNLLASAGFRVLRWLYPEPTYHPCSEPSELWLLAEPDPSSGNGRLPYKESVTRVQMTLASVPLRWRWAGARRRIRRTLRLLPRRIRSLLGLFRALLKFAAGYAVFGATSRTPHWAYESMRELYCRTNGRTNDVAAWLSGLAHPPYDIPEKRGVLGDGGALTEVVGRLEERGVYVFPERLPSEWCEKLREFATESPCRPYGPHGPAPGRVRYDRGRWISTKYDFDEQSILQVPIVQRLVSDPSILAVAQSYLGAKPILDLVAMWWSTAFSPEASSAAAQLYHFDMDRIKFIKFFVYLTEVAEENGPHNYVAHSVKRKPKPLLRDGRIPDREIEEHYPKEDLLEIVGSRGTIFAADTRGFHKGTPLRTGDRLVFQIEFTNSLFGCPYNTIRLNGARDEQLADAMRRYPYTFSRLSVKSGVENPPVEPARPLRR